MQPNKVQGTAIVKNVGKKLKIELESHETSIKSLWIPNVNKKIVREFYELDDVSKQLPGKRDFVIIGSKKVQKKVMLSTIDSSCCCWICENMNLFMITVKRHLQNSGTIKKSSELLHHLVCNIKNFDCMSSSCDTCVEFSNTFQNIFKEDFDAPIDFQMWQKHPITNFAQKKVSEHDTLKKEMSWFVKHFEEFKLHKYLVTTQLQMIREK